MKIVEMYDLNETIAAGIFEGATYPWEVLPKIKDYILELGRPCPRLFMKREAKISGWQRVQRLHLPHA